MSIITTIGLSAVTFLNINFIKPAEDFYPSKQEIPQENEIVYSDYYYSQLGELMESEKNHSNRNRFFVKISNNFSVPIDITGTSKSLMSTEIGYLARILSAESLTFIQNGKAKKYQCSLEFVLPNR